MRDKDGISAGVAVASMASWARARGLTLPAMLDALHVRDGAHVTDNFSLRDEAPGGAERRAALVGRLTASPPERVGDERVAAVASLASDVLRIDLAGGTRVRGPPERHRAEAQVLLRGRRAGGRRRRRSGPGARP